MDLVDIVRTPIPGDAPAGSNCRYEPDFEAADQEVKKLEAIEGGEVDWRAVAEHSEKLLRETSKDFLVIVWAIAAGSELEGPKALREGIDALRVCVDQYWDQAFPEVKRIRARRSAFLWLSTRMEQRLPELASQDPAAIASTVDSLNLLRQLLEGPMDGDDGFGGLVRTLRELDQAPSAAPSGDDSAGPANAAETAAAAASAGAGATAPAIPSPPAAPSGGDVSGPITSREDALRHLHAVTDYLLRTEPHSPTAYLLRRALRWSNMSFDQVYTELLAGDKNALNNLRSQLGLND